MHIIISCIKLFFKFTIIIISSLLIIFYLVNNQQAKQYLASTGKAPALRILTSEMQKDEKIGVFAKQALSAKTWLQNNPENNSAVLKNMIESIVRGYLTLDNAISQAANQIK